MIGVKGIASYVPKGVIDNIERAIIFGENEDFAINKIGAIRLPMKGEGQETSDLAMLAVRALFEQCPLLDSSAIDAIFVITQNPDGEGLPHTSAILQNKLGLPTTVAALDISLGCSGYVYGLFALKGFMEASGLNNGLLITADPYSKIVNQKDRVTSLLFGDAATATWLGPDPIWTLDGVSYGTNGSGSEFLKVNQKQLYMNGRQIFNFASSQVPTHIKNLLTRFGYESKDIDLYCLHQGSNAIIDAISKKFPGVEGRFVKDMLNTGNTVSSSIPLLLEKYAFGNELSKILISGFGVGLSWGSAIITKNAKSNISDVCGKVVE